MLMFGNQSCKNQHAEQMKVDLNDLVLEKEVNVLRTEESNPEKNFKIYRKLIKTADLEFESKDMVVSAGFIKKLVAENQGYITSDNTNIST